jgi:glutamyl/glutaminyl-tRNA synthetase
VQVSRFAPSPTGRAHPGTLLAGLLAWLDARSCAARLLLRLENLDLERARPEFGRALREDLAWLGLDFDAVEEQRAFAQRHAAALDRLETLGVLYPCACSRSLQRADFAHAAGLRPDAAPTTPAELLREFDWARVTREDRVVRWERRALSLGRSLVERGSDR